MEPLEPLEEPMEPLEEPLEEPFESLEEPLEPLEDRRQKYHWLTIGSIYPKAFGSSCPMATILTNLANLMLQTKL